MIPKRLIFIWLGSELPEYGKFCIESFKKVNPDFDVMLTNEIDIYNTSNQDLKDCIRLIESNELNFYNYLTNRCWAKKNLSSTYVQKCTSASDAFRFYLLDKYGGIYLDLDTFPVKPFDEKLLSYDGFAVNYSEDDCDWFFVGAECGCVKNRHFRYNDKQFNSNFMFNDQIHRLRMYDFIVDVFADRKDKIIKKFMNCSLEYGENILQKNLSEYYIDHFRLNSWRH